MSKFIPPLPHYNAPQNIDPEEIKSASSSKKVDKYVKKYEELEKNAAQEVAEKVAYNKHKKRMDFLLELVKALIIAVVTLAIEHIIDIIEFIKCIISSFH